MWWRTRKRHIGRHAAAEWAVRANAFSVLGTFQGYEVNYYGYFEQVYNASISTNVQSVYLVNAADPCFANPGTTCITATILQIPLA
jgi:hypothetical protein